MIIQRRKTVSWLSVALLTGWVLLVSVALSASSGDVLVKSGGLGERALALDNWLETSICNAYTFARERALERKRS